MRPVWLATLSVAWKAEKGLYFDSCGAGIALRVPTPNVSIVDLVLQVEKKTFAEEVNAAFKEYANGPMKGILDITEEPLVSP